MNSPIFGLYGASGFGQEIMHWLRLELQRRGDPSRVVYIDDGTDKKELDGHQVMTYAKFLQQPEPNKLVSIAIADASVRQKIDKKLQADGINQCAVRGDLTFVRGAQLSEGSILSAFVDITSNVVIGRCFHANTYSYVGHDCVIGDYVTLAPKAAVNGNVHIHDRAYIGTGAIIKQGTSQKPLVIGAGAVVGMGAVVTKDVPPGVTVVGNPAKPLIKT
ncbi:acetyltransferase [Halopseudomonas laoshanensis]|uniref:acetyltransferase n=1 Tax=Halopseudomonas laoshanensis TaxID=2268758 RepID=UPI0037367A21